jgi:hypothetical protein
VLGLWAPLASSADELSVSLDTGGKTSIDRRGSFDIVLSRPITGQEGRLAVLVGTEDRTDLMVPTAKGLSYPGHGIPLSSGEREVVVYLVDASGEWKELGRFPLKVKFPGGLEKLEGTPRIDMGMKGVLSQNKDPEPDSGTERDTFQDFTGQIDLSGTAAWATGSVSAGMNVVAVSHRPEALRFSQDGENAQKVDLSRYLVDLTAGPVRFQVGSVSFGTNRHLMQSFSTRGLVLMLPLGAVEISGAALSTTSIVGWDNVLGITTANNNVFVGQLAFELFPSRPGALRIEGTIMDGKKLAEAGFNSGQVTDREENTGLASRLVASTANQRLRVEGGYARSRFTNPKDPLLDQGVTTVAVTEVTRDARYADVAYDVLKDVAVSPKLPLTLTAAIRHDRVDPLFRTVVATPQADLTQQFFELSATLGVFGLQAGRSFAEDNLSDLSSVMKNKTNRTTGALTLPFNSFFTTKDGNQNPLLPAVSWTVQRVHQVGSDPAGAFPVSFVPDQVSTSHTASVEFQGPGWRTAYNLSFADTDNRQSGREAADSLNTSNNLNLALNLGTAVDIALDGNLDRSANEELNRVDRTKKYGIGLIWRAAKPLTLASTFSNSRTEDDANTSRSEANLFDIAGTFRIEKKLSTARTLAIQFLLRYAYQDADSLDTTFNTSSSSHSWAVSSAVNLSLF